MKQFKIKPFDKLWINVHLKNVRIYRDGEIINMLENINGVTDVHCNDPYKLTIFTGELYSFEEISEEISRLLKSVGMTEIE